MHALDGPARRDRLGDNALLRCWPIPMTNVWFGKCLISCSLNPSALLHIARERREKSPCCHPPSLGQGGTEGSFGGFRGWALPAGGIPDWEWSCGRAGKDVHIAHHWLAKTHQPRRYLQYLCEGIKTRHPASWMAREAAAELVQGETSRTVCQTAKTNPEPGFGENVGERVVSTAMPMPEKLGVWVTLLS